MGRCATHLVSAVSDELVKVLVPHVGAHVVEVVTHEQHDVIGGKELRLR